MLELPVLTRHQHTKGIAIRGDPVNPAIVMLFVFTRRSFNEGGVFNLRAKFNISCQACQAYKKTFWKNIQAHSLYYL